MVCPLYAQHIPLSSISSRTQCDVHSTDTSYWPPAYEVLWSNDSTLNGTNSSMPALRFSQVLHYIVRTGHNFVLYIRRIVWWGIPDRNFDLYTHSCKFRTSISSLN